jgi:hypothetical protein
MKNLIALFFLIMGVLSLHAQDPLVIDDPQLGGMAVPFTDTILSSIDPNSGSCYGSPDPYFIDLDKDSVTDLSIILDCYMGGFGRWAHIGFTSYGNFKTLIDTSFITTFQAYDSLYQVYSYDAPYTIVKAYFTGDTIPLNQESRTEETIIYDYSVGYDPQTCVFVDVEDFVGDTCHLAFFKVSEENTYIYFIKVYIESGYRIHLLSARTNDNITRVSHLPSSAYIVLRTDYYDIMGRKISKPDKGFYIERIITSQGVISKKYHIQ